MNNIDTIFFDFDGVILESVSVKGWAFGKLFESYPQHVDEIVTFHFDNGGMSRFDKFHHIYANILKEPLSEGQFQDLCSSFSKLAFDRVLSCEYVPGALEFIKRNHRNISLFIISGTPHDEMQQIVKAKNLDQYFIGVYGSPTSKSFWVQQLINEHQIDPQKSIFVGDAMSDYKAAKDNQVIFVARITEENENVFRNQELNYVVENLFELESLLKKEN